MTDLYNLKILTNSSLGVLVVSGPKARDLMLKRVSKADFSNENFKWLSSSKKVDIGYRSMHSNESKFCWRTWLGATSSY